MELLNAIEPNTSIFVDTSAWIASVIKRDSLHPQTIAVMNELKSKDAKLITTENVLFEFANALSSVRHAYIDVIRTLSNLEIISSSEDLFEKSLTLYRDRNDKEWSLTDCSSFIVMQEKPMIYAFTSDKHFEQAGFIKLLQA